VSVIGQGVLPPLEHNGALIGRLRLRCSACASVDIARTIPHTLREAEIWERRKAASTA
jgi:hypothetical protein